MFERKTEFDAIVVGSGITGGWAAKELTEKGLKVLLLERGSELVHGLGYKGEHAPPWKIPYQGKSPRDLYAEDYSIQKDVYAFNEATRHFFVNDRENPYTHKEGRPFSWIRADVLGGRSITWGRQTYRWSEQDFKANAIDGEGEPWPIQYQDLAPWYSKVEEYIGVSGERLGLEELPDSVFQPPMSLHALEKTIKQRLAKHAPDVRMTIGRTAILTEGKNGRAPCHYCGPCHRGCSTGSYFSSLSVTLPAAKKTGNLTVRSNTVVEKLVHDPESNRISEVRVIDTQTNERKAYRSKLVFLCASTVASNQILLNSASETFPAGMANSSGVLGKYIMDHIYGTAVSGVFFDDMDKYWHGNRPTGTYIPRFRNRAGEGDSLEFKRGYGFQGNLLRTNWKFGFNKKGFGEKYKNDLRKPGPWIWSLTGFGETLPHESNRMSLHGSKKDRFGIPQVEFDVGWRKNEMKMWSDVVKQGERIMKAAGAVKIISNNELQHPPGLGIHEMGGARMGDDPSRSVLNKHNQAHDVPNLFVTDGACMSSSSCVNPSLTYMALTVRACDYAVNLLKEGKV